MSINVDNSKLLDFLELVGRLKHVKRTGWLIKDVENCESIAGHMYRMGIMTFLLNVTDLDRLKCLQIALVHDLAECIVGDLTPHCGVSVDVKHEMEDEAMQDLQKLVGGTSGDLLYELYKEYEDQSTPEAKFVKELDRFDMVLQAFEYEKRDNNPRHLEEFFTATKGKFTHPLTCGLLEELNKRRVKFNAQSHSTANGEIDKGKMNGDMGSNN